MRSLMGVSSIPSAMMTGQSRILAGHRVCGPVHLWYSHGTGITQEDLQWPNQRSPKP